jgi:nucleoside-diphosphate-sugar epimerase
VESHDIVIHLAALIPPYSETVPEKTMAVNFEGTKNLIDSLPDGFPFIFASTYDLFGHTNEKSPPRKSTDPIEISSHYTRSKAAAEEALKASSLKWSILRFGSIIHIALDRFPSMAFELPVKQRLHVIHVEDAALALANAVKSEEIWRKTLLIGGGEDCQLYYGDFLNKMMEASGIGALPEAAFSHKYYTTDWLDTDESQANLNYQERGFQTILDDTAALLGWRKLIMPLVRPFVRAWFLSKSPYLKRT